MNLFLRRCSAHDFKKVLDLEAADVIQPDLQKCGGVGEGQRIAGEIKATAQREATERLTRVGEEIERERDKLGFSGRFGAGLPRVNDGSLLFLLHMLNKFPGSFDSHVIELPMVFASDVTTHQWF